jgi:hypothetical protein
VSDQTVVMDFTDKNDLLRPHFLLIEKGFIMKNLSETTKKRKFKLFDPNREGKGVYEQEDRKPNLKFFFVLTKRKFTQLLQLNLMMLFMILPLLVILGMHNKLFLKGFYNKYEGEKFKSFTKKYTYVGIGLYALVAIMVLVDNIFKLYALTSPAFIILFLGGIAYFVISLVLIKKNFAPEGEKINVIETIKESFKKKEKKK